MKNKKKFFRDFPVTLSHSLIVSALSVTGTFLSCHITVTNDFTHLIIMSVRRKLKTLALCFETLMS